MILSILIPTLPERFAVYSELMLKLADQISALYDEHPEYKDKIEVLSDNRDRPVTTGTKRNALHEAASGEYVWFIDDDDDLFPEAIKDVVLATVTKPDVIGINGIMTTNMQNLVEWEIRIGHPYTEVQRDGKPFYLRFPNHITPMRREHAIKVKFPDKVYFEDFEWADQLNKLNVLKTQVVIDREIYHYRK